MTSAGRCFTGVEAKIDSEDWQCFSKGAALIPRMSSELMWFFVMTSFLTSLRRPSFKKKDEFFDVENLDAFGGFVDATDFKKRSLEVSERVREE